MLSGCCWNPREKGKAAQAPQSKTLARDWEVRGRGSSTACLGDLFRKAKHLGDVAAFLKKSFKRYNLSEIVETAETIRIRLEHFKK